MEDAKPIALKVVDRLFLRETSFTRFVAKTLLLSILALLALLVIYVSLRPGFWHSLAGDSVARGYLLRQILTNGVPVVFLINYVGFTLYARSAHSGPAAKSATRAVVIDLPLRLALFFLAHWAIYAASAQIFGSFGGDARQALSVLGPTIALAATFGNLSGVYLYATAISAYPLFLAATLHLIGDASRGAVLSLTLVFVVYFVGFALVTSGLALML